MVKSVKEDFPHGNDFTVKIVHKDGKDGKDSKTCWFQGEVMPRSILPIIT
jgi:hypothetical protein